jgi:DNA-binding MarR family transcriptional regulator
MHGIVSNLEKQGFVERKNDLHHRRILCTALTQKGHKVVAKAHDMIRAVETRMLATVSPEHKALLEKLLLECFNNLQLLPSISVHSL